MSPDPRPEVQIGPGALRIRSASLADLAALKALAIRTFRNTFARQNTPGDMGQYLERWFSQDQLRSEPEELSCEYVLVFVGSGPQPIGYAKLQAGPVDPSVKGPERIELGRVYVDRGVTGQGVGVAVMGACLRVAAARGHRTIWLGVWEHNSSAIEFYRRWGFTRVGTHEFLLGSDRQTDEVMERSPETTAEQQNRSGPDRFSGRSTTSHSPNT